LKSFLFVAWCSGNGVGRINEVTLCRARLVPGWVTVFGWANHLGSRYASYTTSHPGQLSLLPSVGRAVSSGQSVVMPCGWGVKARWLISYVLAMHAWVAGKL